MSATASPRRIIPPPLFLFFFLLLGSALQFRWPVELGPYSFRAGLYAGLGLIVLGGLLSGWALVEMARVRTPIEPWKSPVRLVTSGPFRITRNPLYLTLVTVSLSLALMVNSAWLAATTGALILALDRLVIVREEEILQSVFGEDYTAYRARVRRWV